jgi:hypothetical protein
VRAFSRYVENQILNLYFRGTQCKAPEKVYLGLFLSPPGRSGNGKEVSGKGYSRVVVSFAAPTENGRIENSSEPAFPHAEEAWGTVGHFGVWDSPSGGNLIAPGELDEPVAIVKRMSLKFPPGSLSIEFAEIE